MNNNTLIYKKTRFAPTPSGFLHAGNIFSFAITSALAAKTNAKVLLRIDDMDPDRIRKEYVQDIFDTLNFMEIPWHEGPRDPAQYEREYSQLHRLGLYNNALEKLKESGNVFACTCSRSDILRVNAEGLYPGTCKDKNIPFHTKNVSWRLDTSKATDIIIKAWPENALTEALPRNMHYFIVRKKDGLPAYQLTSVVDDMHFGIDLVVRGEDLWPSTLAQLYMAAMLGYRPFLNTRFHHHALVKDTLGIKLSKSAGADSLQHLRKQYKQPAAAYSFLGKMLGVDGAVKNWQDLVNALYISHC